MSVRKPNKKLVLGPAFSSPYGRVHIPGITTNPSIFADKNIYINSVCAGHAIVDESDVLEEKAAQDEGRIYAQESVSRDDTDGIS